MTKIFVGNLSYQTTDSELAELFGAFGTVDRASVIRDRDAGQSRGFGFVEMPNSGEASKAMGALNGHDLGGRTLNVNEARPREPRGVAYGRNSGDAAWRSRRNGW
jgi:cold-inducible RNA-binding protein